MGKEQTDPPFDQATIETITSSHELSDGTTLSIVLFRPESVSASTPQPVLLQRTPYWKPSEPPTEGFAARAIAEDYVLAFEDTRGRGESDGQFQPWQHERTDGAETIEWLAEHEWASSVGMFGGSSPGQLQVLAATAQPDALGAIAPTFTPSDLHRSDFFQDGALSAMTFLTWSLDQSIAGHSIDRLVERERLSAATAEAAHAALSDALDRIPQLVNHRPFIDIPARIFSDIDFPDGVSTNDIVPHWTPWLSRPQYDEYWQSFDPEIAYDQIEVPGMHTTGWYELCQHGTVTNFSGIRERSSATQHLVIGPWAHQNQGRAIGAVDFGPAASAESYGRTEQLLAFFDTYLRNDPTPPFEAPETSLIETFRATIPSGDTGSTDSTRSSEHTQEVDGDLRRGTGQWIEHASWPPESAMRVQWYLTGSDPPDSTGDTGSLSQRPPDKFESPDSWWHEPDDPVPTVGGPLCCRDDTRKPGAFNRQEIQSRDDVLTYVSPKFESAVELSGPVSAQLTASTTAEDADFCAILTHVTDAGEAYNLCEGIRRCQYRYGRDTAVSVPPGEPFTVEIDMWNIHYLIPAGDRLRLEITSSNHPRFDVHPGTKHPWRATADEVQPAKQRVYHELDRRSVLTVHQQ